MLNIRAIATRPLVLALLAAPACSPGMEAQAPEAAQPAPVSTTSHEPSTNSGPAVLDNSTAGVVQRHFKLFKEGDLKGLLADYADSAFLLTAAGPVKGKDALKAHFSALIEEFGKGASSMNLGDLRVRDDIAYITWSGDSADNRYEIASDTFLIRNGKIVAHTFTGKVVSKGEEDEKDTAGEPAELPESPTSEVLKKHLASYENSDFEALLADYTIDSLILTQKGKKSGKAGVKDVYEAISAEFKKSNLKFEIKNMLVDGEVAYVVWNAKNGEKLIGFITETLVVRSGKIASQSVTLGMEG